MNCRPMSAAVLLFACLAAPTTAGAQVPELINYQGRLLDGTNLVNDQVDMELGLWTNAAGPGTALYVDSNKVTVVDGLYSTFIGDGTIDGTLTNALTYSNIYVGVKVNGTSLSPREPLVSVSYALKARGVVPGSITTESLADAAVTTDKLGSNSVTGAKIADNTISNADLAADAVTGDKILDGAISNVDVAANTFWSTDGNAGTAVGTHFMGTTDGQPLDIRANSARALRLIPDATSPSLVGGHSANTVSVGVAGGVIGGGGNAAQPNYVTDNYGTVGGGSFNRAGNAGGGAADAEFATVAGGNANMANGRHSAIGGGIKNVAGGMSATIGGGTNNAAAGINAVVGGGYRNAAARDNDTVAGGSFNTATGTTSTVGGGSANIASGAGSTIAGGQLGVAAAGLATIGGGQVNVVTADYGTVAGGLRNTVGGQYSAIGGGANNTAEGTYTTIGGGRSNAVAIGSTTVAGGSGNRAMNTAATVAGGQDNTALALRSSVGGGFDNEASAIAATVGGGQHNLVNGSYGVVGGGRSNRVSGDYSVIVGGESNFVVSGSYTTIGGGGNNNAALGADGSVIGGGFGNVLAGDYSTISGGRDNTANNQNSTIGGGVGNAVNGNSATIAGGTNNWTFGENTTIGGGRANQARGSEATVGGGGSNQATNDSSTIAGGFNSRAFGAAATVGGGAGNWAVGQNSTIAGGSGNQTYRYYSTVAGGINNVASNDYASVGGGVENRALGVYSVIGGGSYNQAAGTNATVPGGVSNVAGGAYSFAAGRRARATNDGAFVWADSSNADFSSTAADQFLVRASGGMGLNTVNPQANLHVVGSPTMGSVVVAPSEPTSGDNSRILLAEDDDATYGMSLVYDGGANQFQILGENSGTTNGPHVVVSRDKSQLGVGGVTALGNAVLNVQGATNWSGVSYDDMIQFASLEPLSYAFLVGDDDLLHLEVPTNSASEAEFIECVLADGNSKFRFEVSGNAYADGAFSGGGADYAEMITVSDGAASVEPGDLLAIDPARERAVKKCSEARSARVAGVYSTKPGFVGSEREWDEPVVAGARQGDKAREYTLQDRATEFGDIPMAVVGIVPCKASAENGAIQPGDLLVASGTPGHAMRDDDPKVGTVIGKALGSLEAGTGVIKVLVTLQ
ncbi:MAG: hypothetical protein V1929_08650 [bacterium]